MIKLLLVLLVSFSFSYAHADAAKVKDLLQKQYPQLGKIEKTNNANILGLYEVVAQGQLFYTDEKAQYLISGNIYDLKTMSNLTEERSRKLFAMDFNSLPFDLAIKKVKGNGKRKMAYFSDPNCGFCKKLENELKNVDNVTLYLFMLSIFQGSDKKVEGVWCSKDQVKAWDNLMLNNVLPAVGKCNAPTAKLMALSQKLNINGTPALIFADGILVSGFRPAAVLEKSLDAQ
ncbi:MAG: DsbC family protein [Candidatus Nitrotoga sp.]